VTHRLRGIRRAAQAVGLGLAGAVLVVAGLAAPAGADPVVVSPPGANPVMNGGWIAFSLSSTTSGSTVTLSPDTGIPPVALTDLWGAKGNWPSTWSAGGITLTLVGPGPCTIAANPNQSCEYKLSGSTSPGSPVVFGEGTFPPGPPPDRINVAAPPPPTTTPPSSTPPPPSTNFSGPPNGLLTGPGQFTFNAPGEAGVTYAWTLTNTTTNQSYTGSGPSYTPPPTIFSAPGHYTLTLTATDAAFPSGLTSQVSFEISPPAPTPSPTPTPGPAPASPPALSGLATRTVSYVPLTNFDVPTPAAIRPVTVIWLWRPDWFQTAEAARTAGRPSSVKRATVSVNAKGTAGPSAAPWLAGIATFGIFGFAWVLLRRRRVRTSILD